MIRERLATALVLAAGLLLALFALPLAGSSVLFAILLAIGAWEWAALAGYGEPLGRAVYVAAAVLIGVVVWQFGGPIAGMATLAGIDAMVWILALVWMLRYPVHVPRGYAVIAGLVALPLGWWLVTLLLGSRGPWWVLLLFAIVAAADIGAFFSGRAFGRIRLAPAVSPGKTWEGVAGGLLAAAGVGAVAALWLGLPVGRMVTLTMTVAAISVLGDLTISMLKRSAGLKDTGKIFPGHGGVLDRIDSLLAALPVYLLGLGLLAGS